jgi:hypothetical protein
LSTLAEAIDAIAAARSVSDVQRVAQSAARQLTRADGATLVMRDQDQCHYVG